jgi:hypothetical protein
MPFKQFCFEEANNYINALVKEGIIPTFDADLCKDIFIEGTEFVEKYIKDNYPEFYENFLNNNT